MTTLPFSLRPRAASALLLAATGLLTSCATPESQLRTGLMKAGLSPSMAGCMARPMAHDLSSNQLYKLRSLTRMGDMDPRNTSYGELMYRIRALQDPEILRVTTAAALGCALR